jgi:hypothetical protein
MMNMNDLKVDEMKIEALPCRDFLTAVIEVSFGFCCAYFLFVGFSIVACETVRLIEDHA